MQTIFPGIILSHVNAHTATIELPLPDANYDQWAIIHCKEGRMEGAIAGQFCYLEQGDMLIVRKGALAHRVSFPLQHFHGIVITFDIQNAVYCFSCCLQNVHIDPERIRKHLLGEKEHCIIRESESVAHLFSELYAVPDSIRDGYCKVKLLELMLFLSAAEPGADHAQVHTCTRQQSELAKGVADYLAAHIGDKITLSELTKVFHASGTQIKTTFRTVYGVSVGNYLKTRKMESAAYMLEHTQQSILAIALEHGYDNSSKFAAAFRSVKGMTPRDYRKNVLPPKRV
ncbi:MAG: AraC family transcriptional regulator [Clostridia bacterium]|nr:AraC family transcriptional regulator [Clostridia bacterium]